MLALPLSVPLKLPPVKVPMFVRATLPQVVLAQKAVSLVDSHAWVTTVVPMPELVPPMAPRPERLPSGPVRSETESRMVNGDVPEPAVESKVDTSSKGEVLKVGGPNPLLTFSVQPPTAPINVIAPKAGLRSEALPVQPAKLTLLSQMTAVLPPLDSCIPKDVACTGAEETAKAKANTRKHRAHLRSDIIRHLLVGWKAGLYLWFDRRQAIKSASPGGITGADSGQTGADTFPLAEFPATCSWLERRLIDVATYNRGGARQERRANMTMRLNLRAKKTAVLSMDLQAGIVAQYARDAGLIPRVGGILAEARKKGVTVIHVRVGFRPGLPEVSARNVLFGAIRENPQWQKLFEGAMGDVDPGVGVHETDVMVTKHRVDAFYGTDLEMILRAKETDTLILFGIATSGVVLSTLLHASDADYRLIVVKDCCVDQDAEVHSVLMEKIFSRRATVVTAEEILKALAESI